MNADNHWYAIYTRPNFEKKLKEDLSILGIKNYCPIIITKRKWSDRWKKIETPLLRSIIFVHIQLEKEKSKILSLYGVHRFLSEFGKNPIIPDKEIQAMRDFILQSEKYDIIGDVEVFFKQDTTQLKNITQNELRNNRISLVLPDSGIKISMKVEKQQILDKS